MSDLPFVDFVSIGNDLAAEGWRTPNTYCTAFDYPENEPGVYLFAMIERMNYRQGLVAYVGMSVNLRQRLTGHPIKRELDEHDLYIQTWFKRTPKDQLRSFEADCIRRFLPPWNIAGKPRGLAKA